MPATVNVSAVGYTGAIEGDTIGVFRFTRDGDLSAVLNVGYSVGEGASRGSDYTTLSETVHFAINADTVDVSLVSLADNDVEDPETVDLILVDGTDYQVGSSSTASLTITDNPPVVTVDAVTNATEGGSGEFHFLRTGGDLSESLTVSFSVGGSASSSDFSGLGESVTFLANSATASIAVAATTDNEVEMPETVEISFVSAPGVGGGTLTITDDPPVVTVTTVDVAEGEVGQFVFTRTGGKLSESLLVTFNVSSTADPYTDFTGPLTVSSGEVTFASDSDTATVTLTTINDSIYDQDETVTVTVSSGTNYIAGAEDQAVITIGDTIALTFTLNGDVGAIKYEIPWNLVDVSLANQSLAVSGFNLNLAGEDFAESTAAFTSSPVALFEYGEFVGLSFAIDTSATPSFAYSSLSISGMVITALAAGSGTPQTVNAFAKPEVKTTAVAPGLANGSVDVTFDYKDVAGAASIKILVYNANGVLIGGSLLAPVTKKSGTGIKGTGTTPNANADVLVVVQIFDKQGKVIIQSAPVSAKTK